MLPALTGTHRVCAYDRPGTLRNSDPPTLSDRSSPVAMPRTAQDVVGDLHALLAAAHLPGPYILVGHSLGGLFARLYAQSYPDQVCAEVFVDAFGVEIPSLLGSDWPAYRQALDEPLPQFTDSSSFEVIDIDKSVAQVADAPVFPPIPTVVLTRTEPFVIPPSVPAEQGAGWKRHGGRPPRISSGCDHKRRTSSRQAAITSFRSTNPTWWWPP